MLTLSQFPAATFSRNPFRYERTLHLQKFLDGFKCDISRGTKDEDAKESLAVGGQGFRLSKEQEDGVDEPPEDTEWAKKYSEANEATLENDSDICALS